MTMVSRNRTYARIVGGLLNAHGAGLTNLDANDPRMQAAIKAVQAQAGLPLTGMADPQTFAVLKQAVPPAQPAQPPQMGAGSGATLSGGIPTVAVPASAPPPVAAPTPTVPPQVGQQVPFSSAPDFSEADPQQPIPIRQTQVDQQDPIFQSFSPDLKSAILDQNFQSDIAPHNNQVMLQRALASKIADIRGNAVDVSPGVSAVARALMQQGPR